MKINRFLFLVVPLFLTSCDLQEARMKVLRRIDPRASEESDFRKPQELRKTYPLLRKRNFRLAHAQALLRGASHTLKDAQKRIHNDYSSVIAKIDDVEREVDALLKESDAARSD